MAIFLPAMFSNIFAQGITDACLPAFSASFEYASTSAGRWLVVDCLGLADRGRPIQTSFNPFASRGAASSRT